jgi:ketosteroid isomerase-like protein
MHPLTPEKLTADIHTRFAEDDPAPEAKTREQVRVDAVGDLLACLVKGDLDGFVAALTPDVDVALHTTHSQDWILQAKGREAVREMVIRNFGVMTDQNFDTEGIIAQGDSVVMFGRERGRWKSTGDPYDFSIAYRFTFRDGLVNRISQISAPTAGS